MKRGIERIQSERNSRLKFLHPARTQNQVKREFFSADLNSRLEGRARNRSGDEAAQLGLDDEHNRAVDVVNRARGIAVPETACQVEWLQDLASECLLLPSRFVSSPQYLNMGLEIPRPTTE
jgi:hypothetical protein